MTDLEGLWSNLGPVQLLAPGERLNGTEWDLERLFLRLLGLGFLIGSPCCSPGLALGCPPVLADDRLAQCL